MAGENNIDVSNIDGELSLDTEDAVVENIKIREKKMYNEFGIKQEILQLSKEEIPQFLVIDSNFFWKYEDGKWQIKEAIGTRQGNLLY